VDIIFVQSTVFGDLGAASEDHAGIDLQNDVRRALILLNLLLSEFPAKIS
jgi:hypothetical protein